ncbi:MULTISPECIES: hypothetical protein [Rhizobium/Agrobacterium group]|uniref:hypothetical protein n=1 Tax=Rhizobium/Agrobacterium group TaxID=227290 RepID=UPI003A7F15F1
MVRGETEIQVATTNVILATDSPVRSRKLAFYGHGPIIRAIAARHPADARQL